MGPLASDRAWTFAAPAERVWAALSETERFGSWWPWLRRFEAPAGLTPGAEWICAVKPPLPYVMRFTVTIGGVEAPRHVEASLHGDIVGRARLDVAPTGEGTSTLRLQSSLQAARRPLAVLSLVAGPMARWGHDWVLATGMRQFSAHALALD